MSAAVAQTERQFQTAVIEYAQRSSWLIAHFHDSRRQVRRPSGETAWIGDAAAAGFPDLVASRHGRLIFAELKSDTGRLSVMQSRWLDVLRLTSAEVYLWRPSQWGEIEETLR